MAKTYAILGSGMQGTCAAYDLALHGGAEHLRMGDISLEQAQRSADRINRLVGRNLAEPFHVDALNPNSLRPFLEPATTVLSCVPYWMHPHIAPVAIATHTHMIDLGGETAVGLESLGFHQECVEAGVSIVPDCGLAPGLVNDLGSYMMEHLDETETIRLYCGGLPQNPKPPLNYKLVFNIEGLVAEYDDDSDIIRDGKLQKVETLTEIEPIHIDGVGDMEAFHTSGGASTMPFTLEGRVKTYEYKTIRFPGHAQIMKVFKDFGFWGKDQVHVKSGAAAPLDVFIELMNPRLKDDDSPDMIIVRGVGEGLKDGKPKRIQLDILDRQDPKTGFSAMERMTGFSAAIYAAYLADGKAPAGCLRYESVMPGAYFVQELKRRGIDVREQQS